MSYTVQELAELVEGKVRGDGTIHIAGAAPAGEGRPAEISFATGERQLASALRAHASCLVVDESLDPGDVTAIVVGHPRLAFARMLGLLYPTRALPEGIHPYAVVEEDAKLRDGVCVGPHAYIGRGVRLGDGVVIAAGVVVGEGVQIGRDSVLYPNVVVYPGVVLGQRVIVHAGAVLGSDAFGYVDHGGVHEKFPQIGGLEIGDDVEIGGNIVQIGEHCLLCAQVGIAGSSVIEDHVTLGGQVGVADYARVETGAIVGAQGGVARGKIVRKGQVVWGTPTRPIAEIMRQQAHLARLPKLAKTVAALAHKLGLGGTDSPERQ